MPSALKTGRFLTTVAILAFILTGFRQPPNRELCIPRTPLPEGGEVGYELIDFAGKNVWGTRNWTPEEYAEFSLPFTWTFWRKNDPRIVLADRGQFLQSPGCHEGQYSFMQVFDREFVQVVKLHSMALATDSQGLIRQVDLEKHHVLHYSAGRMVSILKSPSGQRFMGVSKSLERSTDSPTLPEGWTLEEHRLTEELRVDLLGRVSVLRLDNEDSYQGPILESLDFKNDGLQGILSTNVGAENL